MPLLLQLTDAGLDAIVAAEAGGTDTVRITELGLTANNFTQAPTLTALPGEFKRIDMISGEPVAPNIIHMTAYDGSIDVYDVRGLGLYLDDGTLLATFVDPDPVFRKAALAFGLFVFDIAFSSAISGVIEFGNATFLYPPATESTRGTARLATQARVDAETDAGDDFETIVTPKTLRVRLNSALTALQNNVNSQISDLTNWVNSQISALTTSVNAQIATLTGRTITGGGLVTGGGDLSANRVLSVAEATLEQIRDLTGQGTITPARWADLQRSLAQNGWYELPGGLIIQQGRYTVPSSGVHTITFPLAFPNECFAVVCGGGTNAVVDNNQTELVGNSITSTNFQVTFSINTTTSGAFIAIGR